MGSKFSSDEELRENHPQQKLWHEQRTVVVKTHNVLRTVEFVTDTW